MPPEDGTARSPLFSLPAELRTEIWKLALIPPKIYVSSSDRPVTLRYFTGSEDWSESNEGLSTSFLSLSSLPISRTIHEELLWLLHNDTIWCFPTPQTAWECLGGKTKEDVPCGFGGSIMRRLRRIDIMLGTDPLDLSLRPGQRLLFVLKRMPCLRSLTLHLVMKAFVSQQTSWDRLVGNMEDESHKRAANYVAAYTWEGLETKTALQERNLSKVFMEELRRQVGTNNIRVRQAGHDRYAGPLLEVVVSGRNSITSLSSRPTSMPDL